MNKITLKARGQQFEYSCPSNVTPLRAARNQFIPIPTGCVSGGCGMCKVKVVNGEYEQEIIRSHDALSDEELANGYALACCMKAKMDLEIIAIEDYEKAQQESLENISGRS
ncbi:2Fe-2S iron-sulfur cluster-binding protein [Niallia endozanthoxylica]|uniref:2Fe-2S iron-sulfur cluster binding domain-containing protein n=1 Tax=Niallia endozanthoxylica TaxID=2036016 RepID=A0A5J5GVU2_9BACI|nr:2Fe-2S iron-sulfur cluster binding domain-containing protein [Niallia endozanthoxylica]KAA9011768.1 2Fe-2S iron-sulfur cluster binding domain-containing protein [Niallia endozanthoxylica]